MKKFYQSAHWSTRFVVAYLFGVLLAVVFTLPILFFYSGG